MTRKRFISLLEEFVKIYHDTGKINKSKRDKIIKNATAWNDVEIMDSLIKRIDEHRIYEEDNFPFQIFADNFLSTIEEKLDK